LKPDISFIPEKLLTPKLRALADREIEYPYKAIKNISNDEIRMTKFIKNRKNYLNFEAELGIFAINQLKYKNYKLAFDCIQYLNFIGSRSSGYDEVKKLCEKKIKEINSK
jgi:hypothetical protein